MSTKQIAGHTIKLTDGCHYIASRTMGECDPVSIKGYNTGETYAQISGLTYDEANELLNAFNHGEYSFDGRIW